MIFGVDFSLKNELIMCFIDLSNVCVLVFMCNAYKSQYLKKNSIYCKVLVQSIIYFRNTQSKLKFRNSGAYIHHLHENINS